MGYLNCELVVETFDQALFTFCGEKGLFMHFGKMGGGWQGFSRDLLCRYGAGIMGWY